MHNNNDAFDAKSEGFGVYSIVQLIEAFSSILNVSMWFWTLFYPLERGHNGIF